MVWWEKRPNYARTWPEEKGRPRTLRGSLPRSSVSSPADYLPWATMRDCAAGRSVAWPFTRFATQLVSGTPSTVVL